MAAVSGVDAQLASRSNVPLAGSEADLDGIAEAYAEMDERRAIKSLVRVGSL
jgi:hypothetical protein